MVKPPRILKNSDMSSNIENAERLYKKVKQLIEEGWEKIDKIRAKQIIEYSNDAINEYKNTNQEKKVELREIIVRANQILPPDSIEDLKKKSERFFLARIYPQKKVPQILLFSGVISVILIITLVSMFNFFKPEKDKTLVNQQEQPNNSNQNNSIISNHNLSVVDSQNSNNITNENSLLKNSNSTITTNTKTDTTSLKNRNEISSVAVPQRTGKETSSNESLAVANSLLKQGKYQEALKECDRILSKNPRNREAISLKSKIQRGITILNQER